MSRSLNFVVIYRPPPSARNRLRISTFLNEFDDFLEAVDLLPGKPFILGDLNVHFDIPAKSDVAQTVASLSSHNFVQIIDVPTHEHGHTLDPFIIRVEDVDIVKCHVDENLSGHSVVCAKIAFNRPDEIPRKIEFRPYKNFDHEEFDTLLAGNFENNDMSNASPDDVLSAFESAITYSLDSIAPVQSRVIRTHTKPRWYNQEIQSARCERRRFARRYRKERSNENWNAFVLAKKHVCCLIVESKKRYFKDVLHYCS